MYRVCLSILNVYCHAFRMLNHFKSLIVLHLKIMFTIYFTCINMSFLWHVVSDRRTNYINVLWNWNSSGALLVKFIYFFLTFSEQNMVLVFIFISYVFKNINQISFKKICIAYSSVIRYCRRKIFLSYHGKSILKIEGVISTWSSIELIYHSFIFLLSYSSLWQLYVR